jgi:hypothetical protein
MCTPPRSTSSSRSAPRSKYHHDQHSIRLTSRPVEQLSELIWFGVFSVRRRSYITLMRGTCNSLNTLVWLLLSPGLLEDPPDARIGRISCWARISALHFCSSLFWEWVDVWFPTLNLMVGSQRGEGEMKLLYLQLIFFCCTLILLNASCTIFGQVACCGVP